MRSKFFALFMFFFSYTFAGERFVFTPINSSNGLSENRVRVISQLPDGRMVIVTEGLVNVFNGTSFNYIHFNDNEALFLSNYTGFHHVYVDSEGYIWLKSHKKLLLFDVSTEMFVPDIKGHLFKLGISGDVADFFMDANHDFWFLLTDNRLVYLNTKTKQVFMKQALKIESGNGLLLDIAITGNEVYLFYQSGLMVSFDKSSGRELYRDNPFNKGNHKLPFNTLMVVTHKQHIYTLYNNAGGGILLRFNSLERSWEHVLKTEYWLNTLTIDTNGECLVSSAKGIWHINNGLQSKEFTNKLYLVDGEVFETEISTQYKDNLGGLWVGTYDRGLLYHHPDRFKFKNYGRSFFQKAGVNEIRVLSMVEYSGNIFAGTSNGLFVFKNSTQQFEYFQGIPVSVRCNMLYTDSVNRLWICAGGNGLYVWDSKMVRHFQFPHKVLGIYEKSRGHFYLFSNAGVYDFWDNGQHKEVGFKAVVYQVAQYNKDSLLAVTNNGIAIINVRTGHFSFANRKDAMFRHRNHQYNTVYVDSRNIIWFGTQDGLYSWAPNSSHCSVFGMENGLVNNCTYSIIEDCYGRIWVSTANGISCIEVTATGKGYGYSFAGYNQFDGIIKNEFMPRAVCATTDNKLFWGGLDGINEIALNTVEKDTRKISIPLFTKFLLSGVEIMPGREYGGKVVLHKSIVSTSVIRLKHNQNFIGVEFSALNYINPNQTQYRYMLEGVDNTWNVAKSTNGMGNVVYTNLQPGIYKLRVSAAINSNNWYTSGAILSIIIDPPFWKSTVAYIVYYAITFGLLYLSVLTYIRRKRKKMELQQREELDKLKMAFFTNISHELRTPLTLILAPLNSIIKRTGDVQLKLQLGNIYRNATDLLNQVNHLLDFRKIEAKGETLHYNYCNIEGFVSSIVSQFSDLAKEKRVRLHFKPVENSINAYIDREKFRIIINNLLSNALKFTPIDGEVSVSLEERMDGNTGTPCFAVKISDTGCGIPESELNKLFDRFYQVKNQETAEKGSGIGLYLVSEYAKMHQGKIEVESVLNVGSTFILTLPLNLTLLNREQEVEIPDNTKQALKILIVEDNAEFREFLKSELSLDYPVITATNGKEGLEMVYENMPDMVISDVMMPEMTGTDLCKYIKADIMVSHIPVILLTARASDSAQIEGYGAGADEYITKPFNMDVLQLRIKRIMQQQKERKEFFQKSVMINPDKFTANNVDEEFIRRAVNFVETNIANPRYLVDELSKDMCMERSGLYRKLVAIVGQKPSSFIRSVRLKHAAQLISKGIPVSEVSEAVGYSTLSYFSRCFQEEFGVPPSQYKG